METVDVNELIEKILAYCYKSNEEICWLPFEKIFENGDFDKNIIDCLKNKLSEHKNVRNCGIWDYCIFIRVNKYSAEDENDR